MRPSSGIRAASILSLMTLTLGACALEPQRDPREGGYVEGRFQVCASAGLGADPVREYVAVQGLHHVRSDLPLEGLWGQLSVGPLIQVGFRKEETLVAPTLNARSRVDIPGVPVLKCCVEGGLGPLITKKGGGPTRGSLLLVVGGGMDHRLGEHWSLSAKTYLNFAVGATEQFFVSVLLGVSYHI